MSLQAMSDIPAFEVPAPAVLHFPYSGMPHRGWDRADICGAGKADGRRGDAGLLYGSDRDLSGKSQRGEGSGAPEIPGIPCVYDV